MDEEVSASFWISFFVEAGIPPAAAANYAILFTDNRIQKHMLLDLNKEYLKDMGVNVLGDIIAILKHAKLYHEKAAREKVLASDKSLSVQKAKKHLNELLHKEDHIKVAPVVAMVQKPVPKVERTVKPPLKKMKVMKAEVKKEEVVEEQIEEDEEEYEEEDVEELKRKVMPAPKQQTKPVKTAVSAAKKTSVFERLGDSNVTSTTPENPESAGSKNSVFNRLGQQSSKNATATVREKITAPTASPAAAAATTPAASTAQKKTLLKAKTVEATQGKWNTTRMDAESVANKPTARQRLGLAKMESQPTIEKANPLQALSDFIKPSVKVRLDQDKTNVTRTVPNNTAVISKCRVSNISPVVTRRLVKPPSQVATETKSIVIKPRQVNSTQQTLMKTVGRAANVKERLGVADRIIGTGGASPKSVFKRLGTAK